LCGCVGPAIYVAKRGIVHDDWVYVKSEKTLYRRYVPKGVRLPGNKKLLDKVGSITNQNDLIITYPNFEAAQNDLEEFSIDEDSLQYVPE